MYSEKRVPFEYIRGIPMFFPTPVPITQSEATVAPKHLQYANTTDLVTDTHGCGGCCLQIDPLYCLSQFAALAEEVGEVFLRI